MNLETITIRQQVQIQALIEVCEAQAEQLRLLGMFHNREKPRKSDWDKSRELSSSYLRVAKENQTL